MNRVSTIATIVTAAILLLALLFPPWNVEWHKQDNTPEGISFSGWHFWGFQPEASFVKWNGVDESGKPVGGVYSIDGTPFLRVRLLLAEVVLLALLAVSGSWVARKYYGASTPRAGNCAEQASGN